MSIIYQDDTWSVREISADGAPLVVRTRCNLPSPATRERYANLVLIRWTFPPSASDAPAREDHRGTIYFEDDANWAGLSEFVDAE
jgi:hypothetical protein